MAPDSQPGDLAYAKGKIYVAEEFGTPPAIAIVDAETGGRTDRNLLSGGLAPASRACERRRGARRRGLFGTDMVAVVDTRDDTLLGPWDSNPTPQRPRTRRRVLEGRATRSIWRTKARTK